MDSKGCLNCVKKFNKGQDFVLQTVRMMRTEREIQLQVLLVVACEHLVWALDYARRVAQRQVVESDLTRLLELRMFIQNVKQQLAEVLPNDKA